METQETTEEIIASIKDKRQELEARILAQHSSQLELLSSLESLVPDIVSSLDLSLKVVSSFNGRPFTPTPVLPELKNKPSKYPLLTTNSLPHKSRPNLLPSGEAKPTIQKNQNAKAYSESNSDRKRARQPDGGKFSMDDSGSPLSVVRSMVAVCLLERVPFTTIDSSTVLRKLENDQKATSAEKAALREVGGDSGAILAVEMALRSMAEDSGGVELEEFVVSGKSRVMVLGIDRTRLMKELPESANFQLQESSLGEGNSSHNQNQQVVSGGGVDVNGGVFGMGGPMPRPIPEMWMGPGDPNIQGLTPMFPGSGPGGAMAGGRGAPRMMGMMGMPRGMGLPPLHRPLMGPNVPMAGPNSMPQKPRTEEDDMKDLEALLSKKSFRELQKSKTGEELLDLIHRPTARETAVAAKVYYIGCFKSMMQILAPFLFCYVSTL